MPYLMYNCKFKREIAMLDEGEWEEINILLHWPNGRFNSIKDYADKHGVDFVTARENEPQGCKALEQYYVLGGRPVDHPEQIYNLRLSLLGALCPECTKPFRTPRAKLCVECGYELPDGQLAGPADVSKLTKVEI